MASSTAAVTAQVLKVTEDFAVNFHKNLAEKIEGNFVSSALSAYVVLSMAAYGAGGVTAEEMRSVLRLPVNEEESYRAFREVVRELDNVPNVTLKVANKIFGSNRLKMKEKFKSITSRHFHSQSEELDFSKADSANVINQWCSDKTNGKVDKIIESDQLTVDTTMILLNAVYFKGSWKNKFKEKNTKLLSFHINETATVDVPTMSIVNDFFYKDLKDIDAESIALPYANEEVFMIIVVPRKVDGLKHVEKNLEKISFDYETDFERYKSEVFITLPKFNVKSEIDMIPSLKEMGMINMFSNQANFSKIFNASAKVSNVQQKALIEVNEEGSEAAAIAGEPLNVVATLHSYVPPIMLHVDNPFFYKIMWKRNTIFSGRIVNPLDT
ncbi:PREDICTED: alaserpin-like [Ceratosolen solmsi marchali]|uniref:Alaserpin-like n=1 Tax=Ceratosolen solmsi marchali TaxID=326594 RepID=A0AAJ6YEJ4_9HYME|nr:PREDICTED: alaserpin-like [Ceratosolen solmsi marchali]